MDRLQTELDRQIGLSGDLAQKCQHIVGQAIGPGADCQADDLRMIERLEIQVSQPVDGGIGVRGRLKIGQEVLDVVTPFETADALVELLTNRAATDARLGLKLRLSQNTQPPTATVPSTFGQVNPASRLTFWTRCPNFLRR